MCFICDGGTLDEALDRIGAEIQRVGWTLVPVGEDLPTWVYTIGLTDHGHAELVMTDTKLETAVDVLDHLAGRVCAGERFDTATGALCWGALGWGGPVGLLDVHPSHVEHGLIDFCLAYYGRSVPLGPAGVAPRVRQVVLPDEHMCTEHKGSQRLLDSPATGPPGPADAPAAGPVAALPNRAARRATRRRRPRRPPHGGEKRR